MAPPNYDALLVQIRLPGLNEAESAVAKRWLEQRGMLYDEIQFNVPLGPQVNFPPGLTEPELRQMNFLWATKADIIARHADTVTIIEVKERLTKSATGQLLHYGYWFLKQHPDTYALVLRAIAARADEGVAESTLASGIDVELYGGE
jgi:hypothetical protein